MIYKKFVASASDNTPAHRVEGYAASQVLKLALPWCLDHTARPIAERCDSAGQPITVTVTEVFVDEYNNEVDAAGKIIRAATQVDAFAPLQRGYRPACPQDKPGTSQIYIPTKSTRKQHGALVDIWTLKQTSAQELGARAQADADKLMIQAEELADRAAKLSAPSQKK